MKIFIYQLLLYSSIFNCFGTDKEIESPKISKKINKIRQSQPINIVNISISTVELKQILESLQQLQVTQTTPYQTSKETLQTIGTFLGDFVDRYKYWLPITTISFVYCSFLYKIMATHKLLNSNDAWCNWKSNLSFAKLLSVSQKELALELISDIQKKYTDPQNPTNFVTPMVNFINNLNYEIQELETYTKLINSIKALRIQSVYPIISDDKLIEVKEKINKLAFIKNIFSEWSVEFKQQQLLSNTTTPK